MSTTATPPLVDFVHEMERLDVPPFRPLHYDNSVHMRRAASEIRDAAYEGDAKGVACYIRQVRLERLWQIESWLSARHGHRHLRIETWLHRELQAIWDCSSMTARWPLQSL